MESNIFYIIIALLLFLYLRIFYQFKRFKANHPFQNDLKSNLEEKNNLIIQLQSDLSNKEKIIDYLQEQLDIEFQKNTDLQNTFQEKKNLLENEKYKKDEIFSNDLVSELQKRDNTITDLQSDLSIMRKIIDYLQEQLDTEYQKKNDRWNAYQEKQNLLKNEENEKAKINNQILSSPSFFYKKLSSCMTKNESRMFFYINKALETILPDPVERNNYYVFPQVNLHAFFYILKPEEQTITSKSAEAADLPRRKLVGKNVDYIICYCYKNTENERKHFYAYQPILMIELDGKSHFSDTDFGKEKFERQRKSDLFKNALAHGLDISLLRYKLAKNDIYKEDMTGIEQALTEFFQDYKKRADSKNYFYDSNGKIEEFNYFESQD